MSELARAMAPVVRDHDYKLSDLDHALELTTRAVDAVGGFAAMRLQRERRAEQRKADAFHAGRGYDWSARLTTAPGAERHENRAALDQMIKQMQRTRDRLSPGTSAFFKAQAEVRKLTAMAAAA